MPTSIDYWPIFHQLSCFQKKFINTLSEFFDEQRITDVHIYVPEVLPLQFDWWRKTRICVHLNMTDH